MFKKIAIFGGTGMTGQCVVEYALKKGEQSAFNAILTQFYLSRFITTCHSIEFIRDFYYQCHISFLMF